MGEKLGIKELKELVNFGLKLGEAVDKSLADDGKLTLTDAPNLYPAVMAAGPGVMGISSVYAELKDLDSEEAQELVQYVKDEFDLSSDAVEAAVEGALELGVQLWKIVSAFKKDKPTSESEPT